MPKSDNDMRIYHLKLVALAARVAGKVKIKVGREYSGSGAENANELRKPWFLASFVQDSDVFDG